MGAYLRKMAIDGYIVNTDTTPLKKQYEEMHKIGVNINQIAKKVNTTGDLYPEEMQELKEMVKEIYIALLSINNLPYEKVGKNEPVCIADEVPFEIPKSWEWVRWGTLSESIQYGYNAPAQENGRIKMVRISDIQDNSVMWKTVPYCDIKEGEIDAYLTV